jgi:hypothetical protein
MRYSDSIGDLCTGERNRLDLPTAPNIDETL